LSFSLNQIFPKPFNPTTRIDYEIVQNETVELKIFDILGGEVEVLVNEYQNPGKYEVNLMVIIYRAKFNSID
jgi:hypothetical protein